MRLRLKVAVRDWDYLTPLVLGDVQPDRLILDVSRVETVVDWSRENPYDAGEVSFSEYVVASAQGAYPMRCFPHFLMRGFRHRCMLTRIDSPVTRLEELAGKRVGVTGWPDSGNTWTRALLRRVGVGIDSVHWFVGSLDASGPFEDRLGSYARPGCIDHAPGKRPLTELLRAGELDAVFSPFLPKDFFSESAGLRFLLPDFRDQELQYFKEVGYVPGMHLLGIRPQLSAEHPWVGSALSEALEESARVWENKRLKYADTTPWLLDEIARTKADLPTNWNANGLEHNERMINDFAAELYEQHIVDKRLDAKRLFNY